jgi:biopolymer transport protein ExbD
MKSFREHFLWRQPGLAAPFAALLLNAILLGLLLFWIRASAGTLRVATGVTATTSRAGVAPLALEVRADNDLRLDGEPISTLADLQFRLEGKSAANRAMTVRVNRGVEGATVMRVLEVAARGGVGRVSLDVNQTTSSVPGP